MLPIQPEDPSVRYIPNPNSRSPQPTQQRIDNFRRLSLENDWTKDFLPDFDFDELLVHLSDGVADVSKLIDAALLQRLIDGCDRRGDLWCWGPNGVVRRLIDSWPDPQQTGEAGP